MYGSRSHSSVGSNQDNENLEDKQNEKASGSGGKKFQTIQEGEEFRNESFQRYRTVYTESNEESIHESDDENEFAADGPPLLPPFIKNELYERLQNRYKETKNWSSQRISIGYLFVRTRDNGILYHGGASSKNDGYYHPKIRQ